VAWLDRCDAELANFLAALEWLPERGRTEDALRLGGALTWFWGARRHLTVGQAVLSRLLALPGKAGASARGEALIAAGRVADYQGDFARAVALLEQAVADIRSLGDVGQHLYAKANYMLGLAVVQHGDPARAEALARESLALTQPQGDRWGVAWSLNVLGI